MRGKHRREKYLLIEDFAPAYLELRRGGKLAQRSTRAQKMLVECRACPRNCGVDRRRAAPGFCVSGRGARVASAFPHLGEEDCLRGWRGSGTIFFARCNLGCVFCQNADISQADAGHECDAAEIAEIMLSLQAAGCHNINFVTPSHVVPQIIEAVALAAADGLNLPIVYNSSAYDEVETLRLLDGIVDIYMPDFKFWDEDSGGKYLNAPDYPEKARSAVAEMHRQVGLLRCDSDGLAKRGVLVRHLVMPGKLRESTAIFHWLAETLGNDTFLNIMGQYRPANLVGTPGADESSRFEEINRPPSQGEIAAAYEAARGAGLWRFDVQP